MRKSRPLGFTLIELLCCILIISVLAAILFPVLARSIERTKVAANTQQLRQLHHALELYKIDHDPQSPAPYGYPDFFQFQTRYMLVGDQAYDEFNIPEALLRSKCGKHPNSVEFSNDPTVPGVTDFYVSLAFFTIEGFEDEFLNVFKQDNPPIVVDPNCNPHSTVLLSHYSSKLFIRLKLDGSVQVTRTTKPGYLMFMENPDDYQ